MTALCPIPIRHPSEEKKQAKTEDQPMENQETSLPPSIASQNIPPAPEVKKKKTGRNILFSLITSIIITALISFIFYFLNLDQSNPLIMTVLILILVGCFLLFLALRSKK